MHTPAVIGRYAVFYFFLLALVTPGPSGAATDRVADVLSSNRQGDQIVLEGYFVREINYETILFEDDSGQIEVVIEVDDLLSDRVVAKGWKIELRGELTSGYRSPSSPSTSLGML